MTAQEILKLIESVDPADEKMMDEIDACVYCLINRRSSGLEKYYIGNAVPQYTRSRDALKAIRPEGWHFKINSCYGCDQFLKDKKWDNAYWCILTKKINNQLLTMENNEPLPTEELAELHAIIQATEHERKLRI